jgi:hypothetical protein
MRTFAHLGLLALTIACTTGCPSAHRRKADDLKVTRAVLYQNGIGYFERQGKVKGQKIKLRILPDQIADVLKSLTVVDLKSGRAVNVALPVEKTQLRRLAALPPQVRRGGGMLAIARAFRGARARVSARGSSGTGRIVGVENLGGGEDEGPNWRLSILRDDGTLQSFDMKKVRALQIKNRTLEVGLRKALDVALDQGAWKPVELVVHLAGETPHDLLLSYVVEMPTWKPAYRVVVSKDKKEGLLQGWAVVDNVSGEDWEKVQLSLTAGTPLTFTYDLYSPRYVRRPDLSPQQEAVAEAPPPPTDGAAPVVAQEAAADEKAKEEEPAEDLDDAIATRSRGRKKGKKRFSRRRRPPVARPKPSRAPPAPPPPPRMTNELLQKSFRALVSGTRVGSLFRYDIEEPVTIRDRQSALVSILDKKVPAEDVLLYRMDVAKQNPYRAVRLTNTTGYIIEKGPVAIYKDGNFVGEAVGGQVEAKTSTFIPYSVDSRVVVSLSDRTAQEGARLLKIQGGKIVCEVKQVAIHKYSVFNRSGEPATLYVQRRHRTGWKLTAPTEGLLVEKEFYFVPITLAKKGKTEVEVKEETPVRRWVAISSHLAREAIALYLKDPAADAKLSGSLREALALQDQIGKLDRELARLRRAKQAYSQRQDQVRANIKLLGKSIRNADLARKLTASLKQLENDLNKVTRELVQKDMKRSELHDRLTVLIKSITLEVNKS